jgi:membrane associated rhomboid family serine protease
MQQASVGFQCPECVKEGAKASPTLTARHLLDRTPIVTYALIALNAAALVGDLVTGGSPADGGGHLSDHWALVAAWPSAQHPLLGVDVGDQWYRLITGGFMHAGIFHFGMNMLVLWLIGTQLERVIGPVRYATIYVVSLLAGSFAVMLASPADVTVGASAAIFGVIGAAAAFQRSRGINIALSGLGGLILVNLLITFTIPHISIAGHVGGLIGGLVFGWVVFELERLRQPTWLVVVIGAALSVGLVYGGIWAAHQFVMNGSAVI